MQSRKGCRSWESWRRKMGCEEMRNPFLHSPSFFLFSFLHHYGQTAAQVLPEPLGHGLELLEFHRRSPGGGEGQDGTAVQDGRFDGLDGSGLGIVYIIYTINTLSQNPQKQDFSCSCRSNASNLSYNTGVHAIS